jgi:hypothetical protein
LIGEKISLRPVLLPIAKEVGGELLLPTGETSDTMIAELAARCAIDPRLSVILYFSDFDPAGRQRHNHRLLAGRPRFPWRPGERY